MRTCLRVGLFRTWCCVEAGGVKAWVRVVGVWWTRTMMRGKVRLRTVPYYPSSMPPTLKRQSPAQTALRVLRTPYPVLAGIIFVQRWRGCWPVLGAQVCSGFARGELSPLLLLRAVLGCQVAW